MGTIDLPPPFCAIPGFGKGENPFPIGTTILNEALQLPIVATNTSCTTNGHIF